MIDAGDQITIQTGSASITMKKDGTITIKGKDITIAGQRQDQRQGVERRGHQGQQGRSELRAGRSEKEPSAGLTRPVRRFIKVHPGNVPALDFVLDRFADDDGADALGETEHKEWRRLFLVDRQALEVHVNHF